MWLYVDPQVTIVIHIARSVWQAFFSGFGDNDNFDPFNPYNDEEDSDSDHPPILILDHVHS